MLYHFSAGQPVQLLACGRQHSTPSRARFRDAIQSDAAGDAGSSRLSVRQLIYADKLQPYVVMYQMGRNKSGDWKLRNVIIESVNLGAIYKDQFLASAREQAGNIDAVIDSWTTVVVDVEN